MEEKGDRRGKENERGWNREEGKRIRGTREMEKGKDERKRGEKRR